MHFLALLGLALAGAPLWVIILAAGCGGGHHRSDNW
jgi:RNase adaptor protein for sRNA GlmZ degradation